MPADELRGPDGMKFGTDGRLYCTVFGQGVIAVLNARARVVEKLPLRGPNPTNCAFALDGGKHMRVTEIGLGQVEELAMPCGGLPLHKPKLA